MFLLSWCVNLFPMENSIASNLSRRRFIKWGLFTALLPLTGWRVFAPSNGHPSYHFLRLSKKESEILLATMSAYLEIDWPKDHQGFLKLDQLIKEMDTNLLIELKMGLHLFNQSPLFSNFYFKTFSALTLVERRKVIEKWKNGPRPLRPLYKAFKEITYFTYYASENSWEQIGYDGPLVDPEVGQRNIEEFNLDYEKLLFRKG